MKSKLSLMAVGLLLCLSGNAEDWDYEDYGWGVRELEIAQHAATEAFKAKHGQAAYDAVSGFAVERSSQGIGAKVKITYVDGGQSKTASLFCHQHDASSVDCH